MFYIQELAQILDAYSKHCPKVDRLSGSCSFKRWCFWLNSAKITTPLQGHFQFAISTWMGIHPPRRPTISAFVFSGYWFPKN